MGVQAMGSPLTFREVLRSTGMPVLLPKASMVPPYDGWDAVVTVCGDAQRFFVPGFNAKHRGDGFLCAHGCLLDDLAIDISGGFKSEVQHPEFQ